MNLHMEKCMRIVSDLVGYCHIEGADEFHISVTHDKDNQSSEMSIVCVGCDFSPQLIEEVTKNLTLPRQREVEQDYWTLSGESEMSGELALIGMMIDSARVCYQHGTLRIDISRKD